MVYENNFSVLRLYYPSLAEKVDDIAANGVTIVQARSGSYTCKISTDGGRWIYLHSRYDPEREVELLLQNLDLSRDSILALLGLGLGYLFFAILSKLDRDYPILVFEKRVDVFKRSLELFDWREPLKRKNLRFFIGKEIHEIEEEINEKIKVDYWSDLLRKDIKLLKHPPSINLYPDYYHRIEHAINESRESFLIRRMEVIKNTRLVDRLLWGLKDVLLTREGVDSVKDSIEYTKGLVSIIMPVHNRLECLKEVLASLYKYTTYSPWELIIWDNNSNEETKTYLRGLATNPLNPKIRTEIIFHPENIGKNCLNRCIKEYAQGEYIIIMDSDIVVTPNWLEGMVEAVDKVPKAGYLTANMDGGKIEERYYKRVDYGGIAIEEGPTGGACTIIRRDVYRDIGEFLEMEGHIYICEDGNYSHRAREMGYVVGYIQDVWVYHRSSPAGVKDIEKDWSFEARIKSAIRYLTKGLYQKALITLADVREEGPLVFLLPNHPHLLAHIYNLRGLCYLQKGDLSLAIEHFKKAISLRSEYVLAYYNLGSTLAKGDRLKEAKEVLGEALGIEPEYDPDLEEAIKRIEENNQF